MTQPGELIYLDYAATTPLDPIVLQAMMACYQQIGANPASQHRLGRQARRQLEDATEAIGRQLGASIDVPRPDRVILTSGGTEANNLALRGWHRAGQSPGRILVTAIEHPSSLAAADELERWGWQIDRIRVNAAGQVELQHLDDLLQQGPSPRLVSVMWANNETGVLQPVEAVVERCQARGIPVHVDAVQVAGKLPISFASLGATTMAIAAHKFHGPVGVGVLLVRADSSLSPILFGGSQQLGMRPGTESVALAVGMEAALGRRLHQGPRSEFAQLQRQRDRLQSELCSRIDAIVNGAHAPADRVPQTLNLSIPGLDRQALLMALDFDGICCSTGAACASGSSEPSHVLRAMGLDTNRVSSAIRLSVGVPTTDAEIDSAIARIEAVTQRLRAGVSSGNS
ncbi:MAG: cysteine desulfurase [Planctomycetales bacterium]|nr:cysteine desulfurase [Planctomycetales bacterium]